MKISCEQFLRTDTKIYSQMSGGTLFVGFIDKLDETKIMTDKKTLKVFNVISLSKAKELQEHLAHYIKLAEEAGSKYKGQP